MRIINIYTRETKKVIYRGNVFDAPIWVKYMAVDADGELRAFVQKPCLDGNVMWYAAGEEALIADVDLDGADWKETLKEL